MRDEVHVERQDIFVTRKSVDLTGVLECRATMFECLRHNHLSLPYVSSMRHHKPDLSLFRSMAGTGDLLSNHALGLL